MSSAGSRERGRFGVAAAGRGRGPGTMCTCALRAPSPKETSPREDSRIDDRAVEPVDVDRQLVRVVGVGVLVRVLHHVVVLSVGRIHIRQGWRRARRWAWGANQLADGLLDLQVDCRGER